MTSGVMSVFLRKKSFDIGKYWLGRKQPASVRLKRSIAVKKLIQEGKFRIWNKGKHLSAEHKRKLRLSNLKAYENMALRGRIDRQITRWWREHPNIRRINSEKMKKELARHPDALRKFMENRKNPFAARIKTKNGLKVRSKGEKEIADFLFENKIKVFYEAKPLILDGNPCVPDFWLPKFKCYIEFYGGYPGAWKKKVLKNKLYRKNKIPVISITPAELRNLDYCLMKEIRKL
jgi:hypothetical protein